MLGSVVVEFILSICFYFFLLSMIVSTLVEIVGSWWGWRSKALRAWVLGLDAYIGKAVYEHPLIRGLRFKKNETPSYIDKTIFAKALLEVVTRAGRKLTAPVDSATGALRLPASSGPPTPEDDLAQLKSIAASQTVGMPPGLDMFRFTEAVRQADNDAIRKALDLSAAPDATKSQEQRQTLGNLLNALTASDATKTEQNVADWYRTAMDRLGGSYKRRTQVCGFVLGFLLAFAVNADAVYAVRQFWSQATKNQALPAATAAVAIVKSGAPPPAAGATPPKDVLADALKLAGEAQLPWGWSLPMCAEMKESAEATNAKPPMKEEPICQHPLWRFLGYLLTALAVMLGSSFWFDLLSKFVNLRQAGKKPANGVPDPKKSA